MTKNVFIYVVVVLLVGVTAWFFVQKSKDAAKTGDINSVAGNQETVSPSPSPSSVAGPSNFMKMDNGLEIQDVVIGSGREAVAGDTVSAHYTGSLADGTVFDSSYGRGQPFSFILGGGMVIQGWDLGLVGMKVGGKRKLIIPANLAYGNREVAGGVIPPNSTLYFDIELVAVQGPQGQGQ